MDYDQNQQPQQPVQEPVAQPTQAPQPKGLSIASMILGICALVLSCCVPYLPFFLALVAVVLGGLSLAKKQGGKGMAIAGLVCGIIALIPSLIVLIGGAALTAALEGMM